MAGPTSGTETTDARVVGRYILFGEIAAGGMATVHFGRLNGPVGFSRTVAIKRLHAQFAKDPEFVTMFLDEARLAGRIRHPNVVPTLDVVATDGEIFLVMEYVQGESLARLARAMRAHGGGVPADVAVTILAGALHGLHAAHQAKDEHGGALNIVHRDVSPQNVLVGTDGVARVLDFGVAKAAGRLQTTREGQIKGKIAYMAPEQVTSGEINRQTDIYAASVVLWETLTGRRLFEGDNEAMVLMKALEGKVPPPSSLVPGLSAAFDEVVLRGVARRQEDRFATAREMALALERCSRMASPSEVGEWVERTAADELTKRAARVADIESASSGAPQGARQAEALIEAARSQPRLDGRPGSSRRYLPGAVDVPIVEGTQMRDIDSQLSSISVARSGVPSARGRARTRFGAAIALGVVAFIGVMAVVVLGLQGASKREAAGAAPRAPPVAAADPPSPPPAAIDPELASPRQSSKAGAGAVAAPTAAAPSVATNPTPRPAPRPAPRPSPQPQPAAAAAKSNCDPPFSIDAAGHKKYKLECMTK